MGTRTAESYARQITSDTACFALLDKVRGLRVSGLSQCLGSRLRLGFGQVSFLVR